MATNAVVRRIAGLSCILVLSVVLLAQEHAGARTKRLTYIPPEHDVELVKLENQDIQLRHESCGDLADAVRECENCGQIRDKCSDCCLIFNADGHSTGITCDFTDDPAHSCQSGPAPFEPDCASLVDCANKVNKDHACTEADSCSSVLMDCRCQYKGCLETTEPANGTCREEDGIWYCSEDNLRPQASGCSRQDDPETLYQVPDCSAMVDPYLIEPEEDLQKCPGSGPCFRYDPAALQACTEDCQDIAASWEDCVARQDCCVKSRNCPDGERCDALDCRARIDSACDVSHSKPYCDQIVIDYNNWLTSGDEAVINSCFRDITDELPDDKRFKYRFVARSNERLTFTWTVFCDSLTPGAQASMGTHKFYTAVKVIDVLDRATKHASFVHQKTFSAPFTITATTTFVPLQAGRVYEARIYYFIPLTDENLNMKVSHLYLNVHRTRE